MVVAAAVQKGLAREGRQAAPLPCSAPHLPDPLKLRQHRLGHLEPQGHGPGPVAIKVAEHARHGQDPDGRRREEVRDLLEAPEVKQTDLERDEEERHVTHSCPPPPPHPRSTGSWDGYDGRCM